MDEAGIGSFIVEARPHPDYLSYGWWRDLDLILDEAEKRGMQVYLFDDSAYPSGFGDGKLAKLYPESLKRYMRESHIDAIGPKRGASLSVRAWLEEDERMLGVVAVKRRGGYEDLEDGSAVDLTAQVVDGMLCWDVPEGAWRIFLFVETRNGGEEHTRDYVNPIDAEAVRRFIEVIYEEHYKRYAEKFGNTIGGFFIDEPRFGNAACYDQQIGAWTEETGILPAVYPYCAELPKLLEERAGEPFLQLLPYLWGGESARAKDVRFIYMDIVSSLFGTAFLGQIGDWCRAHGVQLIGHMVEDNGAHARLGYGCGHFFRAVEGMDTSGLDVVYQIWPGYREGRHKTPFGYLDSRFFYWGLPKLASSAAQLDPKKRGVTVCEIFGAYGWQEGLKLMKWLTDHVCVRGVNLLIPHAFSPKYPDPDCPPHFYARGKNPQWEYFSVWSDYTNRVCELLTGGEGVFEAAVLYHAEAQWGGACDPFEKAVQALTQRQVGCIVVPADQLEKAEISAETENGRESVTGQGENGVCLSFGATPCRTVLVPYAQALPEAALQSLLRFARAGLSVCFLGGLPERAYGAPEAAVIQELAQEKNVQTLSYDEAAVALAARPEADVRIERMPKKTDAQAERLPAAADAQAEQELPGKALLPDLAVYHYRKDGVELWFFVNESERDSAEAEISLAGEWKLAFYDAMENICAEEEEVFVKAGRTHFPLTLEPGRSLFVIGTPAGVSPEERLVAWLQEIRLSGQSAARPYRRGSLLPASAQCRTVQELCGAWEISVETEQGARTNEQNVLLAETTMPGVKQTAEQEVQSSEAEALNARLAEVSELQNLATPQLLPAYSGKIRYERTFRWEQGAEEGRIFLDLGEVYETAQLWVNGQEAGVCINPPYRFEITSLLRQGENTVRIIVCNTLAKRLGDNIFDRAMMQEPSGLLGPVRVIKEAGSSSR